MAIKGKSKSRSRRVVAVPPRPPVYVRKPAFWQKRSFLVGLAVAVVLAILAIVLVSLNSNHEKALKERTAAQVSKFKAELEGKLPPAPDAQPAPPTGYILYPTLAGNLDKLAKGTLKDAAKSGQSLVDSAKASADAIQAIVVSKIVSEDASYGEVASVRGAGATTLALNQGKQLMAQSFRLYGTVGQLVKIAAGITDEAERTAVVEQAKALETQASSMFHDGYQKIINLQAQLNGIQPNAFQPGSLSGG